MARPGPERPTPTNKSVKYPLWAISIAAFVLLIVLGVVGSVLIGY